MKACAVTMVYRDEWHLRNWVAYYGKILGVENLFVFSHGDEPPVRDIAKGANIIAVERDPKENVAELKSALFSSKAEELLDNYDCVIVGDVDELLVPSSKDAHLMDCIKPLREHACVHCLGLEVFSKEFSRKGDRSPEMFIGRFSSVYTKACLLFSGTALAPGQHGHFGSSFELTRDIVLLHMKYASRSAFDQQYEILTQLSSVEGYPHGGSWKWLAKGVRQAKLTWRLEKQPYAAAESDFLEKSGPRFNKQLGEWRMGRFFPKMVVDLPDHMRVWI